MESPLISVVMLAFNSEPFLTESITSILNQTHQNFEFIIIVDNGSCDNSDQMVNSLATGDHRIKAVFLPHSSRACAANHGIAMAQGDYIARMDADDIALPARLSLQLDWMRKHDLDVCGSCVKTFGDQNSIIWFPEKHDAICNELIFRTPLLYATAMMRTETAKKHPFNEDVIYEEYELWTRIINSSRFGNVPQILLKERCHPNQSNIRENSEYFKDVQTYRKPYFYSQHPKASELDYQSVAHIGDKIPQASLDQLERAGTWLGRLADNPDRFLRERMAIRWLDTCRRTKLAGIECSEMYQQFVHQFNIPFQYNLDEV